MKTLSIDETTFIRKIKSQPMVDKFIELTKLIPEIKKCDNIKFGFRDDERPAVVIAKSSELYHIRIDFKIDDKNIYLFFWYLTENNQFYFDIRDENSAIIEDIEPEVFYNC